MKKKLLILFLGTFLLAAQAMAQQVTVTGKVASAADGQAVPGASVKIKGSNVGVATSPSGMYSLKVNKGAILVFSYIGYTAQERTVGAATVINVGLVEDASTINEVVVTAFGIERSKASLGYSAQTIKGPEIAATQRDNFINALQGRVAGATITPTNGTPGASSQIIIRGATSLDGDNQPLFIVDGLPISNTTFSEYNLVGQGTYNRNNDFGNRAMDINPEEIASITILKGPEAAALYGTDGASGAVVITTKRAKAGSARVSYSNSFRMENVYRFPDVQNTFGPGAAGFGDDDSRVFFGPKYAAGTTFFDNLGNFYKTGFTQKHNISVEGGTEALSLRTSLAYTDQGGTLPGTGYSSLNARLAGTSKISDKINMNASFTYIKSHTDKAFKGAGSPMLSVLTWPSTDDIRNYLTPAGDRRTIGPSLTAELDNPYFALNNNPNNEGVSRVMGNIGLNYKPTKWLSFDARAGADISSLEVMSAYHPQSYGYNGTNVAAGGTLNTSNSNQRIFSGTFIATAKKDFGKFKPVLRLGADVKDDHTLTTSNFGSGFYQADFYSLNNTNPTTQRAVYFDVLKRKMGLFGQAELGYGDFLYVTLTGRQDFSSTLPVANQSFFYPGASVSFVFSQLPAMKEISWLSFGKLRASWGQSGKDARTAYITKTKLGAQQTTGGGFAVDVTAGNPNLQAEFTTSSEAGIELGFFKDRLSLDFSYFQTNSDKQITAPRLSYGTGAILGYINSGEIRYRGFELLIKGTPVKSKDFTWDVSANFARQRGNILSLPGDQKVFYVSDSWLFDNVRAQYIVGSSLSSFAGIQYLKNNAGQLLINPANGMPVKDVNFTPIGDRAPDLGVGLTNSFTYKNFNLSFLLDMRKGGDIYNASELYLYARGRSKLSLDRETPRIIEGVFRDGLENTANPTKNNIVVIPYITQSYYQTYYDTNDFLEKNINWIRLKDITLSYNLPKSVFQNSKVFKSMNVFFTGTDLLLLTNYKGVDPSVNGLSAASGGLGGSGIDFGSVGLPRGYNFGLKVGF